MKKLQGLLDRIPHWLFVGTALAAGAFVQNLRDQPDFLSALTQWNTANLWKDFQMAAGFTLTAVIAWLRTDPWTAAAAKAAAANVPTQKGPPIITSAFFSAILLLGGVTIGSATISGCKLLQAAGPELSQIESIVLKDVEAGKTSEQILEDVGSQVAGKPGVDVVVVAIDVLTTLVDLGVIPEKYLPSAQTHREHFKTVLATRGSAK